MKMWVEHRRETRIVYVDVDADHEGAMSEIIASLGLGQLDQRPYVANGNASFELTETAWGILRPALLRAGWVEVTAS